MLRAVGWAVLLVVGTAAPAAANGHGAHGIAAARQQDAVARGDGPFVAERTTPVQATNGRNGAHLILRAPIGGLWRDVVDQEPGLTLPMPARRERGGSPELPSVSPGKPTFGLPVSEQLSVAVGYQHVEGEDRWRPYGEAGPVDYDSHDFLLGVAWRF
jgi:hypothetical protein